jgi:hypothetical protein
MGGDDEKGRGEVLQRLRLPHARLQLRAALPGLRVWDSGSGGDIGGGARLPRLAVNVTTLSLAFT